MLAFAACAPEAECPVHLPSDGSVQAAWCPNHTPSISVAPGCAVEVVREAAALWAPLLDGAQIFEGTGGEIMITVAEVPGHPIGHALTNWIGHALTDATVTVESCDVQLIGHELGHALGFTHSPDVTNLMHESTEAASWTVTAEQLAAYARARGVAP